jgi:hypothetical protein
VETGDLLTLAGGLALVLVIAIVMNPQYLSDLTLRPDIEPAPTPVIPVTAGPAPVHAEPTTLPVIPTPAGERPDDPPYQIVYTDKPFTYPRFKLPESMVSYGASDIPLRAEESVPFAFVTDSRGGLTRTFSVPYPVWVINTTVIANRTPQYGNFKMVLCYATNGSIIEGEEILNRGSSHRIVQVSGAEMYMIITTAYIDSYFVSLGTPRSYYNAFRP